MKTNSVRFFLRREKLVAFGRNAHASESRGGTRLKQPSGSNAVDPGTPLGRTPSSGGSGERESRPGDKRGGEWSRDLGRREEKRKQRLVLPSTNQER